VARSEFVRAEVVVPGSFYRRKAVAGFFAFRAACLVTACRGAIIDAMPGETLETDAAQLDSRIDVVTPENIAFQYRLAGPFRRLPAYLLDVLIRSGLAFVVVAALVTATSLIGAAGMGYGAALVCWFLLSWFYFGLFETFWNGQTPGKRCFRLRVVTVDGQPINALQAVLRNVLRSVDIMPLTAFPWLDEGARWVPLYMLGLSTMMLNPRFQRLGDLACSTMVVVEDRERLFGVVRVSEPAAIQLAAELPGNLQITRSLARALSAYVARRPVFAPPRRSEIARSLGEPLCQRYNLPARTSHDTLLCALYYRAFIADRARAEEAAAVTPEVIQEDGQVGTERWLQELSRS